jgi:hypothetical protein
MLISQRFKLFSWLISSSLIMGSSGCGHSASKANLDTMGCAIPINYAFKDTKAGEPYQQWQIRAESNRITWNGIDVTDQELTEFAQKVSQMPSSAGSATFQVVGVSCKKRMQVRKALSRSDLCSKGRCWESEGLVKTPIVYEHELP